MQHSSRFAVAIHLLALARSAKTGSAGVLVTSEQMAESVNTNPVVIRRILGALRDAGLVASQPGPGGGWRLSRTPDEITLRDVYRAVESEPLFALPRREPNAECMVGRMLPGVLESCFRDVEAALHARLAVVTLSDVVDSVMSGSGNAAALCPSRGYEERAVHLQ